MNGATSLNDARIVDLLREAAEWRLLGLLLECPSEDWRAQVARLAAEVADANLKAAADAAVREAGEGLYHAVFGPGGRVSPREASYHAGRLPGPLLAELAAFYEAFAYRPSTVDPPDHVAVEVGFLGYLRLKEAYALARGEAVHAETAGRAAGAFLNEHLAGLARPFAESLPSSGITYLALAAQWLLRRIALPVPSRDNGGYFSASAS